MATAFHPFPNFTANALLGTGASPHTFDLASDTVKVLLIASSSPVYTWGSTPEGQVSVTAFLTGDGTHGALTECTGGNYSRQTLTPPSLSTSGEVTTLTYPSPSFVNVTLTTTYALFYDYTMGNNSDATGVPMCYWDFGGPIAVTSATFTLTISASGLITWTNT